MWESFFFWVNYSLYTLRMVQSFLVCKVKLALCIVGFVSYILLWSYTAHFGNYSIIIWKQFDLVTYSNISIAPKKNYLRKFIYTCSFHLTNVIKSLTFSLWHFLKVVSSYDDKTSLIKTKIFIVCVWTSLWHYKWSFYILKDKLKCS